jgi:hypothetical protein
MTFEATALERGEHFCPLKDPFARRAYSPIVEITAF